MRRALVVLLLVVGCKTPSPAVTSEKPDVSATPIVVASASASASASATPVIAEPPAVEYTVPAAPKGADVKSWRY